MSLDFDAYQRAVRLRTGCEQAWDFRDVRQPPATYVAHKAIGSWEIARQALVYAEAEDTYDLWLKATVYGGGSWHEGDAMLIVKRSDLTIGTQRARMGSCASGHTLVHRPAYNPVSGKYSVTCVTDLGVSAPNNGGYGGLSICTEGPPAARYRSLPFYCGLSIGGTAGGLDLLADGGYLSVFIAVSGSFSPNTDYRDTGPVTSLGLVRFDANGAVVGNMRWIAAESGRFLSYPQFAALGNGRYLVGYARVAALSEQASLSFGYDNALRIPLSYHVFEIDVAGNALTPVKTLSGQGWGEQDDWISLEPGKVAWAYTPFPVRSGGASPSFPACSSEPLVMHVYQSVP